MICCKITQERSVISVRLLRVSVTSEEGEDFPSYVFTSRSSNLSSSWLHRSTVSLLRPHHVVRLRQEITQLAKTVIILQEPPNFGNFKHTGINKHTLSHILFT